MRVFTAVVTVVVDGVAPPIPASIWIGSSSDGLWIKNNDVVQFPDFVVSGISDEFVVQSVSIKSITADHSPGGN